MSLSVTVISFCRNLSNAPKSDGYRSRYDLVIGEGFFQEVSELNPLERDYLIGKRILAQLTKDKVSVNGTKHSPETNMKSIYIHSDDAVPTSPFYPVALGRKVMESVVDDIL